MSSWDSTASASAARCCCLKACRCRSPLIPAPHPSAWGLVKIGSACALAVQVLARVTIQGRVVPRRCRPTSERRAGARRQRNQGGTDVDARYGDGIPHGDPWRGRQQLQRHRAKRQRDRQPGRQRRRHMDYGFPGCTGLQCQVANKCGTKDGTAMAASSTFRLATCPIRGRVYVPNSPVTLIASGASCDRCDNLLSGDPITTATTDTMGRFTLANVLRRQHSGSRPSGQVAAAADDSTYRACSATSVDPTTTRLPRTQAEGKYPAHRPYHRRSGRAGVFCCGKLGIADSEFSS